MNRAWRMALVVPAGVAALLAVPAEAPAQEPVRVVVTLPVYASLVREIGGDQVLVTAIADPNEDAHFVRPKPSFALELRRADLFVNTGLDLELWVPPLLDKASNAQVLEGGRGYVTAYTGVRLLDIPAVVDRSQGDIHIYGNPHLHTDPLRVIQIARNITTGLERVAPERSAAWQAGLRSFQERIHRQTFGDELVDLLGGEALEGMALAGNLFPFLENREYQGRRLNNALGGWLAEARELRGRSVICYHKDWAYFEDRFGLRCADYVESKPGIPPTPRHVASLIALMEEQDIRVVIAPSYYDRTKVEGVAQRGGGTAVVLPFYPGGAGVEDYFDLVDHWIEQIEEALEDPGE